VTSGVAVSSAPGSGGSKVTSGVAVFGAPLSTGSQAAQGRRVVAQCCQMVAQGSRVLAPALVRPGALRALRGRRVKFAPDEQLVTSYDPPGPLSGVTDWLSATLATGRVSKHHVRQTDLDPPPGDVTPSSAGSDGPVLSPRDPVLPSVVKTGPPAAGDAVRYIMPNPKKKGTLSAARYDEYMVATTVDEALRFGATRADVTYVA
jgi:hypothetical protein